MNTTRNILLAGALCLAAACGGPPVADLISDLKSTDKKVQNRAGHELVRKRDKAVEPLAELFSSDDMVLKMMVLQVLKRINTPKAGAAVIRALDDASPDVRVEAVKVLQIIPLPSEAETALKKAASDPYWVVRQQAVSVLGRLKTETSVRTMAGLLKDPEELVRRDAIQTLINISNPVVTEIMLEALSSDDPQVRYIAVQALGTLEDRRAVPPLLKILKAEENQHVRLKCAAALGHLGAAEALPLLEAMAQNGSLDEKKVALQAIKGIKNRQQR